MKKPNVLLILSDQHIANVMGCAGHAQAITPNLDRLAREGTRFTRAYTQNPICTPSRVSILSGQYPHNHGYYGLDGPTPQNLPSILGHFKAAGYRTAAVGKLHLPNDPQIWLRDDADLCLDCYQKGVREDGQTTYNQELTNAGFSKEELAQQWSGMATFDGRAADWPYELTEEGWSTKKALEWLAQDSETPFCMELSLPHPHTPVWAAQPFWDLFEGKELEMPPFWNEIPAHRAPHFLTQAHDFSQRAEQYREGSFEEIARNNWRGYLATLAQVDFAIGEALQWLETSGQLENTIIIYTSDHGAYAGLYGLLEKAPGICADSVCRIPFLWRGPGIEAGAERSEFAQNIDIASTIAALCGLDEFRSGDGVDLSSVLRGEEATPNRVAVTENPLSRAICWDNWRLVRYDSAMFEPEFAGELYDLAADPLETRNLWCERPEIVAQGINLLLEQLIRTTRVKTIHPKVENRDASGTFPAARGAKQNINSPMWMRNYL